MTIDDNEIRCTAITKAGTQCKNSAGKGSPFCHIHQSLSLKADIKTIDGLADTKDENAKELSSREMRKQLIRELDELILRVRELDPEYSPPPYTPQDMIHIIDEREDELPPSFPLKILNKLRSSVNEELFDKETWEGIWYMLNYTIEYQSDMLKRRFKGDYETDEWGLDWEFIEAVRPFLDFMYKYYWRIESVGIDNIPDYDRAILVCNHSGFFPWDSAMLMTVILNEHPAQRLLRNLYTDVYPKVPFLSSFFTKMGQTLDSLENGNRLLEQDELVGVFPEGMLALSKTFKDRYKLARFTHGRFVKMAMMTQSPIFPVSIVGAEETYISIANSSTLARFIGLPFFPVSLRFPWLGPLGAIPLPTKWYIDIGDPISMDTYGPDDVENPVLVSQLGDDIRDIIQEMLNNRLSQRKAVFY
jgi:1-acyl-sn-glycerol-3-phosphate acyltransferase